MTSLSEGFAVRSPSPADPPATSFKASPTVDAQMAATAMIERVRARPWGLAVAAINGSETAVSVDEGLDPLTSESIFQIGSITKTFTGVLLADCLARGEATRHRTVGEILGGRAGRVAGVTLEQLATHRSGLPRLPPNFDPPNKNDPYAHLSEDDLIAILAEVELGQAEFSYSNLGFMLLGFLLREITGTPYADLVRQRVFQPLDLGSAGCPPATEGRVPGYRGADEAQWWSTNLPGAGGIGMNIADLAKYLEAQLEPSTGSRTLDEAILTATTIQAGPPNPIGLGWHHQGGGWWHNGGTGGFRSFCAFHRETRTAVALLANSGDADVVDRVGFMVLTEMIMARASR